MSSDDHARESDASIDVFTVLGSDASDAIIFGLRHMLHEVEEGDELSERSSDGNDELAVVRKERVAKWRKEKLLQDDLDFAYVYVDC